MTTTYYARKDYTYESGDRIFTIPFSYLKESHIKVFINDEETEKVRKTIIINGALNAKIVGQKAAKIAELSAKYQVEPEILAQLREKGPQNLAISLKIFGETLRACNRPS